MFLIILSPFGILGWIRTGDGINNAHLFLRFRRLPGLLALRSEVVIFWKSVFSNFAFSIDFGETLPPKWSY